MFIYYPRQDVVDYVLVASELELGERSTEVVAVISI